MLPAVALLPKLKPVPVATKVPLPVIATDVVQALEPVSLPPPMVTVPPAVNVTPVGIRVTCHVPAVLFVYDSAVIVVLTLTTLLTVNRSDEVPVMPNTAVSAAPGVPEMFQLPSTFQLFS